MTETRIAPAVEAAPPDPKEKDADIVRCDA